MQRNAGLMGLAYLEPNTFMDKNSPTYERQASKTADLQQDMAEQYPQGAKSGAPYSPQNPPPIDAENPPDDWVDCGSCGGAHPADFYGDCRDDYNRWPSGITTGEKPIDPKGMGPDLSLHHMNKQFTGTAMTAYSRRGRGTTQASSRRRTP